MFLQDRPPNTGNVYTPEHNFSGLFCWCKDTYEPESKDFDVTMFQCSICTDWFHEKCASEEVLIFFSSSFPFSSLFFYCCLLQFGRSLSDGEVDIGSFVCRDCVHFVRPYVQALRYVDQEQEEDEEQRSQRLASLCSGICLAEHDLTTRADDRSVFLVPDFASFVCKCPRCVAMCTNLLVENDSEEEEEEEDGDADHGLSGAIEGVLATSFDNVGTPLFLFECHSNSFLFFGRR